MRAPATTHAALAAGARHMAALCALFFGAHLGCAAPALAQTSWATVVSPTEPAAPAKATAPKTSAPKAAAATKRTAPAKAPAAPVTSTGSIKSAIDAATEALTGHTQMAADESATVPEPRPPAQEPSAPQEKAAAKPEAQPSKPAPEAPAFSTSAARQFCVNITDAAADARVAWQKKALLDIAQDVDKRVALLEEKIAEYQKWVTRRDEFVKKARDSLVLIYSRMRPDAAALQLVAMDEETAAAVLLRLDPRAASTILNEMEPGKAARLTAVINGAAKDPPGPSAKGGGAGGGKS